MPKKSLLLLIPVFLICPALPAQAQDQETQKLAEIEGLINDGLYDEAIAKIKAFLSDFPTSLSADIMRYRLAELQFNTDKFGDAAETLEAFLVEHPASPRFDEARYLLASAYRLTDKLSEAVTELNTLLRQRQLDDRLRVAALERRAEIALQLGRPEEALKDLAEVARRAPSPQRNLRYGNVLFELGKFKDAERVYSRLHGEASLSAEDRRDVILRLALSRYQRRRYKQVVELLQPLQQQYQDDDAVLMTLAWALYQLERYSEAYAVVSGRPRDLEEELASAIREGKSLLLVHEYSASIALLERVVQNYKDNPGLAPAFRALSEAYFALGDDKMGVQKLEQMAGILTDDKERFQLWLEIGDLYDQRLKDKAGAISSYRKALAVNPRGDRSDEVAYKVAGAQVEVGDLAGAVDTISHFLNSFPNSQYLEQIVYLKGKLFERAGDYTRALEQYRTIAQFKGSSSHRRRAYEAGLELVMKLRRWDDAVNIGREYLQEFPEADSSAKVHLSLAQAYYQREQFKDGIKHFERALTAEEGEVNAGEILLKIGWGYYKLGEFSRAETYFTQITDEHSQEPEVEGALYWLGWMAQVENNLAKANLSFKQLLQRFPQSRYAEISLWQIAGNHLRMGETNEAIRRLNELVDQFPDGQYARPAGDKLVDTHIKVGNYRAALEKIDQFTEADPSQQITPAGMLAKGNALAEAGNLKAALKVFSRLLERFPASEVADEATLSIGIIQYRLGNHSAAVTELRKVQKFFPESENVAAAAYYQGRSLIYLRRYEDAISQFQLSLERGGEGQGTEIVHYLIGICHEQLGNESGAVDAYRKYLAKLTDITDRLDGLVDIAILFARQGHLDEAARQLASVLDAAKDPVLIVRAQFALGEVYKRKGQLEQAAVEFLKVTYVHSSSPLAAITARFRAGEVFEQLGRYQDAINVYQKVSDNHKGTRFGEAAAIRIQMLRKLIDAKDTPGDGTSESREP